MSNLFKVRNWLGGRKTDGVRLFELCMSYINIKHLFQLMLVDEELIVFVCLKPQNLSISLCLPFRRTLFRYKGVVLIDHPRPTNGAFAAMIFISRTVTSFGSPAI